jgi:hypothetical protein
MFRDDDALMRVLIHRHPIMAELKPCTTSLYDAASCVNHLYKTSTEDTIDIGVVLENTPIASALAAEIGCKVYWGAQTDPVQVCTACEIVEIMCGDKPWTWMGEVTSVSPSNCLATLTAMTSKESGEKRIATACDDEPSAKRVNAAERSV